MNMSSIIAGEHHGANALREFRVGRIIRAMKQVRIIIIDLEKEALAAVLECAEVTLAIRIVAPVEAKF